VREPWTVDWFGLNHVQHEYNSTSTLYDSVLLRSQNCCSNVQQLAVFIGCNRTHTCVNLYTNIVWIIVNLLSKISIGSKFDLRPLCAKQRRRWLKKLGVGRRGQPGQEVAVFPTDSCKFSTDLWVFKILHFAPKFLSKLGICSPEFRIFGKKIFAQEKFFFPEGRTISSYPSLPGRHWCRMKYVLEPDVVVSVWRHSSRDWFAYTAAVFLYYRFVSLFTTFMPCRPCTVPISCRPLTYPHTRSHKLEVGGGWRLIRGAWVWKGFFGQGPQRAPPPPQPARKYVGAR